MPIQVRLSSHFWLIGSNLLFLHTEDIPTVKNTTNPASIAFNSQQPRSQSEPQFTQTAPMAGSSTTTFGSATTRTMTTSASRSNQLSRIQSNSPNQLNDPLESSSDFDGFSYGHQQNIRNRMLRSSSGVPATGSGAGKDTTDQCFSFNSLEDFCSGASLRDSILDERRVFRSSDGTGTSNISISKIIIGFCPHFKSFLNTP